MGRWCCILLLCLQLTACISADDREVLKKRANAHFDIGVDALRSGNLPKAFDELMLADKILPHQPHILDTLGNAWRMRGDLNKAEQYFKKALRYGDQPSIHTNYASLLLQMGRFSDARAEIAKTLKDPRYAKQDIAYIILGDSLIGEGKLDEGIQAYRRAGRINPRQLLSRLREARVYANSGRYSFAIALYETLLREHPDNREAVMGLIPLLKQQGDMQHIHHYLVNLRNYTRNKADRAWAEEQLTKLNGGAGTRLSD